MEWCDNLKSELMECASELLELSRKDVNSRGVENGDGVNTGKQLEDLVERYKHHGVTGLTEVLGEERGRDLAILFFERTRKARIMASMPGLSALEDSGESVTPECLFGPTPSTLMGKEADYKSSLPPEAGLSAFVYQIEHRRKDNRNETVEGKMPEIVKALSENRVVLLQGDTGCGKTTKVPRMLLSHYNQIACTQPRRIAAISVARKVAKNYGCDIGEAVGYAVRFDDQRSKSTRLHFLTDGMLLKEISSRHILPTNGGNEKKKKAVKYRGIRYDLIIIDEAHERNINMDFLMGYLRDNQNVKLLVMSATLDRECFINYFNCPFVEVSHRVFPIEHYYLRESTTNYLQTTLDTVIRIVEEFEKGDILVFLTGQEEIEQGYERLSKALADRVVIRKLYSAMPPSEQEKAFHIGPRKVVLSTNIAETSVTIENIRFVVDCGHVKQKRRGSGVSIDFMEVIRISKSQARQRAGRAGRTGPGKVFRIYTRLEYEEMADRSVPEILRSSLTSVILSLKSLGINDVINFNFIDKPSLEGVSETLRMLYYMRAIDSNGVITELGKAIANSPLDPEMALVLYAARRNLSFDSVSTIAAFLNVGNVFIESKEIDRQCKDLRKQIVSPDGDFYTFLNLYSRWHESKFSTGFIEKYRLSRTAMETALQIKMQLMNSSHKQPLYQIKKAAGRLPVPKVDAWLQERIMEAFCAGYFMNTAKYDGKAYITIFGGIVCFIHPKDPLFKKSPKYVLFYELLCIRREYMRGCLRVTSAALHRACNPTKSVYNWS